MIKIWTIGGVLCSALCSVMLLGCDSQQSSNQQSNTTQSDLVEFNQTQQQERSRIIGGVPVYDHDYQLSAQTHTSQQSQPDVPQEQDPTPIAP